MLALLGSLLGFGTSFLPKVMDFFQDKQDKKHELDMQDKILASQLQLGSQKLQMIESEGDIDALKAALGEHKSTVSKASQWVINLSASVRPVMTYALWMEFMVLTVAVFNGWVTQEEYTMVWNNEIQAVWAAVVSFWFGQRSFRKDK